MLSGGKAAESGLLVLGGAFILDLGIREDFFIFFCMGGGFADDACLLRGGSLSFILPDSEDLDWSYLSGGLVGVLVLLLVLM